MRSIRVVLVPCALVGCASLPPGEGEGQGKESGGVTFHVHAKVENGVVVETTTTDAVRIRP